MKRSQAIQEFSDFVHSVSNYLPETNPAANLNTTPIEAIPLLARQCIYIIDWSKSACTYSKGTETFLGYSPEEFTLELIAKSYHPEDVDRVHRIIRGALEWCLKTDVSGNDFCLLLAHRVRHKAGHYLKVLRKTRVYEVDDKGRMLSNFSMMTDISFMDKSNRVHWAVHANDLDKATFTERVYQGYVDFFTPREKEILKLMAKRLSTTRISTKLHISSHTVATHRKNIYRKSGCNSLPELLDFAFNCGILR